jgi:CubicO group peptidase (beta-lactamase class C family)
MRVLVVLLVLALLAPVGPAWADAIDDYIRTEMERRHIPGLALAVARRGKIVKLKGYGVANLEHDVPVTPDTVFELASITKQFTAAAVMLLVEEGKVQLDDPVSFHIPRAPETWKAITVRHLLTHTSGLPGLTAGFKSLRPGGARLRYTTAQLLESAIKDELSFPAGERYQYSDIGYVLLGIVIENASGQRYRDFVETRLFKPLAMSSTSVVDVARVQKHRAASYTLRDGQVVHNWRVWDIEMPSHYGTLSTVKDLITWDTALGGGRVLKPASLTEMWTPVRLNGGGTYPYGFGWAVDERRGHRWISHTGITGTELSRFPDDELTVVVLTNLGFTFAPGNRANPWGLTYGVAGRHSIKGLLVGREKPARDPNPARTAGLRETLVAFARNEETPAVVPFTRGYFTARGRELTAERLKTLKEFSFVTCDEAGARVIERHGAPVARVCHYRLVNAEETRYYSFWLTASDAVVDIWSSTE